MAASGERSDGVCGLKTLSGCHMKSVQIVYTRRMAKRGQVQTELTAEELQERYRQTKDAVERTHWHMLWQIKEGKSPREDAELLGYTARWVRTTIQRWN